MRFANSLTKIIHQEASTSKAFLTVRMRADTLPPRTEATVRNLLAWSQIIKQAPPSSTLPEASMPKVQAQGTILEDKADPAKLELSKFQLNSRTNLPTMTRTGKRLPMICMLSHLAHLKL